MPEWLNKTIGKVQIEKYLARGGMAEVYLGTHTMLDRQVAVKVMHGFIEDDPDFLSRFQREAKVVAGLRHPNIVQVFDFDTLDGHPYIVMEYLRGPSLATYLLALHERQERLPIQSVVHLLKSLASALDYAHGQGVIHRDIKPGNVLLHSKTDNIPLDQPLAADVDAVLTDFGLVRLTNAANQTASGIVSGTPAYMSPEQARGDQMDHRTDIYSLGVVMYEMLAGRVPFEGDSTISVILKHINEPPPPIENISPELQAVIDCALAKDPNARYQTAQEMVNDLVHVIGTNAEAATDFKSRSAARLTNSSQPQPKKPSRTLLWAGGLIAACACVSLALVLLGSAGLGALALFPKTASPTIPVADSTNQLPVELTATNPPTMPNMPANDSLGLLRFQEGTSTLDKVTISAELSVPAEGMQYEAWLIGNEGEQRRSLGLLTQDVNGQFTLTFVDGQSRNLLAEFDRMEITLEPNPDDSPNASGNVAYASAIPAGALTHIRHLLISLNITPNQIGAITGLMNDTTLIKTSAEAMLTAFEAGQTNDARANAEAVINLIVGKQDATNYKDWDGNGQINDPGDGYGLLLNGDQSGYIGGVIDHAKLASEAADATDTVKLHGQHVVNSAQNVETWATQLRDLAIQIVQASDLSASEADIRSAVTLADQMLDGVDLNGNEAVEPVPGEGGAHTAFEHAGYMADMSILPSQVKFPPPAP